MDGRKKTIVLSDQEYRQLELARIKYEGDLQKRADGFGEVVIFLANIYLEKEKQDEKT